MEPPIVMESDDEYRKRMFDEKCAGWGAFWSHVIEAQGVALDECGAYIKCPRRVRPKL